MKRPTIQDVAKLSNVSTATVSRVLNGKTNQTSQTAKDVIAAAQELNFTLNNAAQSLKGKVSTVLGFIVRGISNPNYATICQGAETIARDHSCAMFLCNSHGRVEYERLYVDLLVQHRVAGVAMFVANDRINTIEPLIENDIPVVLIDSQVDGVNTPHVNSSSRRGTYEGTKYLLGIGHRRIAILAGNQNTATGRDRLSGYLDALREHPEEIEPICYTEGFSQSIGYDQTMDILGLRPPVTAIFAASNQLMVGSLLALNTRRVKVPNRMSFLGFDNTEYGRLTDPPISVISRSVEQIGSSAMALLFDEIEQRSAGVFPEIHLPIEITLRESCLPPNQMDG